MVVKAVAAARHWRFALSAGLTVTVVVLGAGLGSPGGAAPAGASTTVPGVVSTAEVIEPPASATAGPSTGTPSGAARPMTGTLPPQNPPTNIPPASSDILVATNDARADEGVGPMNLDLTAFDALTLPEQVFVVENLERTGRGEPPISAMTAQLDSYAQTGAANSRDPTHPLTLTGGGVVVQGGSIWAGGSLSTLFVNYLWMYEDGWGGSAAATTNEDCSPLLPTGCWGHRDIILTEYSPLYCVGSTPTLVMGAADSATVRGGSVAAVFLSTCGPAPTDEVYTWAQAEQALGVPSGGGTAATAGGSGASGANGGGGGSPGNGTAAAVAAAGPSSVVGMASTPNGGGYWLADRQGDVFSYGDAAFSGSLGGVALNAPIVGLAVTPDGHGYWLAGADGGIFSFGDAAFYGSAGSLHLVKPIVGLAATPDGHGYWFVAADGGIFSYGDATFYGSMGGKPLNQPIVGLAATPDGHGYWFVAADGGIFSYGDATFYGSMGGKPLNQPIVGLAATPDGRGYWFVAADGGIFSYGDATFYGSMGGKPLNQPIVGMAATPDGRGYWFVAADGGIFSYGDAGYDGSDA